MIIGAFLSNDFIYLNGGQKMANWCFNNLKIEGTEKEIEEFVKFIKDENGDEHEQIFSFNATSPYPKIFREQDKRLKDFWQRHGFDFNGKRESRRYPEGGWKYCRDNNLVPPRDGFDIGGCDWCWENWGTKVNAFDIDLDLTEPGIAVYNFITKWSPPIPVVFALGERFPDLTFHLQYYINLYDLGVFVMKSGKVFESYWDNCPYKPIKELFESGLSNVISTTANETTDNRISDVQKIAIQSLEDMRGYKFDQLSMGVFGEVKDIDTLTKDEADKIIKYGNHLYKKSQNRKNQSSYKCND